MTDRQSTATAKAIITVEVTGLGSWGYGCELSQIYDQASEEAIGVLRQAFERDRHRFRIIGEPKVTAILISEKDKTP